MANTEEAEARRAMMLRSSWSAAAPDAKHEYMPISSNELNRQYTHCKSASASARFVDFTRPAKPAMNPAGEFVASKRYGMGAEDAASTTHSALGSGLVLGYDARETRKSSEMYGEGLRKVSTPINLLESVPPVRDATLDGAHRASMTETHMPDIWDPYASEFKKGAASFASATMLRDASRRRKHPPPAGAAARGACSHDTWRRRRHTRSAYHPEQRYSLPPTEQSVIGWGIVDKYDQVRLLAWSGHGRACLEHGCDAGGGSDRTPRLFRRRARSTATALSGTHAPAPTSPSSPSGSSSARATTSPARWPSPSSTTSGCHRARAYGTDPNQSQLTKQPDDAARHPPTIRVTGARRRRPVAGRVTSRRPRAVRGDVEYIDRKLTTAGATHRRGKYSSILRSSSISRF